MFCQRPLSNILGGKSRRFLGNEVEVRDDFHQVSTERTHYMSIVRKRNKLQAIKVNTIHTYHLLTLFFSRKTPPVINAGMVINTVTFTRGKM